MEQPDPVIPQSADPQVEAQRLEAARQYVRQLQAFHIHGGVFAGSMVIIFVVNLATNAAAGIPGEWSAWWSVWASSAGAWELPSTDSWSD